jgi:hypothetical protein
MPAKYKITSLKFSNVLAMFSISKMKLILPFKEKYKGRKALNFSMISID